MKPLVKEMYRTTQWQFLPTLTEWTIKQAIRIQQIPAPTFAEAQRAQYVAAQFAALGLTHIHTDDEANVYGLLPGLQPHVPGILISAHTDTVFAAETDLTVRYEYDTIYGPGLGDNSMGVAGLLALAKYFKETGRQPACNVWFVATSGEEGLGDLRGMRAAFSQLKSQISSVINLEGLAFGHVYHAGIAVHRLHITAQAEGGHSWLHFGRASAIHGIMALGTQICRLVPPTAPRTTYNIGMIDGGQSINTIAASAGLWLDMRSEQSAALRKLVDQVYGLMHALETPELRFRAEVVGDRPGGFLTEQHPLVQGALAALELENVRATLETGSTDANIPLAAGCPAVTIGITRGGNAHRLDEYIETKPVTAGLRQMITLTLAAAQQQTQSQNHAAD
jgi:acetylornithine deacetylase/succinyl-diaminopimelate desuccinylase-like protein